MPRRIAILIAALCLGLGAVVSGCGSNSSKSCGCMNGSPPTMPKKTLPIAFASVMSLCIASDLMVSCFEATSTQQT